MRVVSHSVLFVADRAHSYMRWLHFLFRKNSRNSRDARRASGVFRLGRLIKPENPDVALHLAVRSAVQKTGATGSALALTDRGLLVCRARAGDIAPDLGVALDVNTGITGACVRAAHPLNCSDAMTDTRVDGAVCRALGIRSVVVVPILLDGAVVGILEAFSVNANAFQSLHVKSLERIADVLLEVLYGAHRNTKSDTVQKLDSQPRRILSSAKREDAREQIMMKAERPRAENGGQEQDPGLPKFREVFDKITGTSSWEYICQELISRLET